MPILQIANLPTLLPANLPILLALAAPVPGFILLVLGFLALLVVDLIIALIEGVTLTLLHWNPFRPCLTVSLIMNLTSGIINGILLILLQQTPLIWLPVSFIISLLIEGIIMMYFKRDAPGQDIFFVLLANLSSYLVLILPAYYFGIQP